MTHLTDTQSILLSAASQREGGSLLPLPASLKTPKPVIAKSIAALLARGLIEEREVGDQASVHRSDGDVRYGLFITAAGQSAIGAVDDRGAQSDALPAPAPPVRSAKSAMVIALLQRADGATMPELRGDRLAAAHDAGSADRLAQERPCDRAHEARGGDLLYRHGSGVMATLAEQIAELPALPADVVRERWVTVTGAVVPKVSPSMLKSICCGSFSRSVADLWWKTEWPLWSADIQFPAIC